MTTTERAAEIRTALKAKGWTSRDVSVKADYYSMGSAIRIRIKNARTPLALVEAIAEGHESISRCEITGEILNGGNRYVDVSYSSEARAVLAAEQLPALEQAAAELATAGENSLIPIGTTGHLLGYRSHGRGHGFSLWNDGHICEAYELAGLAVTLATRLQ